MSKKKSAKTTAGEGPGSVATSAPVVAKRDKSKPDKAKKLTALDAAARVLAAKREPMTAPELIAAMAAKKLWSSPNGKTPAATLYAAMLREITTKGKQSRFARPERGKFAHTGVG